MFNRYAIGVRVRWDHDPSRPIRAHADGVADIDLQIAIRVSHISRNALASG